MVDPAQTLAAEHNRRIAEKLKRELGDQVCGYLESPDVLEIMLNPDGSLWIDEMGSPMRRVGTMPPHQAESIMTTVASFYRASITRENPIFEGELPFDGSRFEALIPPIVAAPSFTIRRKALRIFTLDEYVASGIMTSQQVDILKRSVIEKRNILVVGSTGSGKTTLTNALLDHMGTQCPDQRLVIIEDTGELQCSAPNSVTLRAIDVVDMQRLLKVTMRMRPDRIIVGEVRGAEALTLIKAWNTGHPGGVATVHADDASRGLLRLDELVSEASVTSRAQSISQTIHLVVFIAKTAEGRRVQEIVSVLGHDGNRYITQREDTP